MIHIQFPTPDISIKYWGELIPFMQLAIDYSNGEINEETIKQKVSSGEVILAVVYDDEVIIATVVFEMIFFDTGKKAVNIQLAGGDRVDEWYQLIIDIAEYIAKERGADDVYIIGRPGWQRKLKQSGFELVHTVLHKGVK